MSNTNKIDVISKKKAETLNSPLNLAEIAHSIFCNIKNLLIGEHPTDANKLNIHQQLVSDEELGLPANGVFSSKFSEILKETLDKKI